MKDVAVGDTVRVVTPEGRVGWSTVCGWLHREPNSKGKYLQLNTSRRQLYISEEHLVATVDNGRVSFVQAREVHKGTVLLEVDPASNSVYGNAITSVVGPMECHGVYAPLTESGTIVVDGVGASCYASTRSHAAAHAAMKPMRAMYQHNPEKFASGQYHKGKHIEGSHRYVDVLARVARKA